MHYIKKTHQNRTYHSGFTIIEVLLFLAVTGMLAVGILVGMSSAIGHQRYRDSVVSLTSDVQVLYDDTLTVLNDRGAQIGGCESADRGRSNCVILGNMMILGNAADGEGTIRRYQIYGVEPANSTSSAADDELTTIRSYDPQTWLGSESVEHVQWAAGLKNPIGVGAGSFNISILVIRSPQSGRIFTFTRNSDQLNNLNTLISQSNAGDRVVCVTSNGYGAPEPMGVLIEANASSANAVRSVTNGQLTGGIRC